MRLHEAARMTTDCIAYFLGPAMAESILVLNAEFEACGFRTAFQNLMSFPGLQRKSGLFICVEHNTFVQGHLQLQRL